MNIQSVVVGGGPVASLVILVPNEEPGAEKALIKLPIRIGTVEASAISMGIDRKKVTRPMTHDLLVSMIDEVGAKIERVRITSVSGTTFFAEVDITDASGEPHVVGARPSDAIAIAVRCGCGIFAEQAVLDTAALPDFGAVEEDEKRAELEEFHNFVENLSPEDFNVADHEDGEKA